MNAPTIDGLREVQWVRVFGTSSGFVLRVIIVLRLTRWGCAMGMRAGEGGGGGVPDQDGLQIGGRGPIDRSQLWYIKPP
jgi:hypothetical protein